MQIMSLSQFEGYHIKWSLVQWTLVTSALAIAWLCLNVLELLYSPERSLQS